MTRGGFASAYAGSKRVLYAEVGSLVNEKEEVDPGSTGICQDTVPSFQPTPTFVSPWTS